MSAVISQKEYIKRYLSKSDSKKKRKKKKPDVSSQPQLRIVDDDIDVSSMRPVDDEELELYNLDEDAPQVAGVIDERPEELRVLEDFRTSKRWKIVSDSTSDIKVTEFNASSGSKDFENNLKVEKDTGKKLISGRGGSVHAKSDETSLPHSIKDSKQPREDSDASPPRNPREQNLSKSSSQNATTCQIKSERITDSDSDLSVSRRSDSKYQNDLEHTFKMHKGERTLPHMCKGRENRPTKNKLSNGSDSDLALPRKSRKTERVKHSIDKQKEYRKKKLDEGSDSDFSLPRPSKSRDRVDYKNQDEARKIYRKKWQSGQSDSDLSPPRPSKKEDKMKHKRPEETRKRQRKKGSSEHSDSDLSLACSKTGDRMKHKRSEEVRKPQRKRGSFEQSVFDLSLPRLPKSKDREEHRWSEIVTKRQRKMESSDGSDSDSSLRRPSKREEKVKHKRPEEMRKRERKKRSSEQSDSDLSPPRPSKKEDKMKHKRPEETRKRQRKKGSSEQSDSDLSLPQPSKWKDIVKQRSEEDTKKYRKKEMSEESDSSLSPPRKPKSKGSIKHNKSEVIRKRTKRKGSSEESASDLSLPPSRNKDTMNFQRQSNQKDGERISRKVESDYSKIKSRNPDTYGSQDMKRNDRFDHSPVRETHRDSRAHPPDERGARKHTSSHGVSSRRDARRGSDSPPRRSPHSNRKFDNNNLAQSRNFEVGSNKLEKTLDGKLAGLQDAKQLREEIRSFAARENDMFSKMSDDVSGRLAKAVQRDRKTGKKRDLEEEARQQREKDEKEQKFKEKYSRWGKGLKQVEDQKQNLEEAMKLMAKPLARYADDEDLDKHLRNQEREGDPMLEYIRSKKSSSDSQKDVKPKYQGSYPTNRFGIAPGYRWDGVDRSSGYEKQWFEQQSAKKAREEEAYKWSTADM